MFKFSYNPSKLAMLRSVTESQKKRVAGRQRYKCAASIPEYTCPLKGEPFDESGYEIDHIKELRDGGTNDLTNLQALCISCHRVKTSRMTTAMSKKDRPVAEPSPIVERLDKYRYQPKSETPKRPLCHHCHDQYGDLSIRKNPDGLWFCSMHGKSVCEYLGCFGKEAVHVKVLGPIYITDKNGTKTMTR